MNRARPALAKRLEGLGLPLETGSYGLYGLTKFNRARLGIPKANALDAACIGHGIARIRL
jgi:hypothetical protein